MTIQSNIERKNRAIERIEAHCMCADWYDDGYSITVHYPAGDSPVDGVRLRAPYTEERVDRMLAFMEAHLVAGGVV